MRVLHPFSGRPGIARHWSVLLVLCGAIFLEGIDVAMLNVALPSIRAELGLSTGELQWVMSAYVLGYGGFMLLGGRAADLFGRRRMFIAWLIVFLVFSGLGGFATEGWVLLVARFVTGAAAAFMTPAGLSIITTTTPAGRARDRALLVYAGTAAGGFSLGLVAGGLLTAVGWRWVFFVPVILSFVILVASLFVIPRSHRRIRTGERADVAGAVAVTAALLLLVLTVERASHVSLGWTLATLGAGLAFIALFVMIEKRSSSPLVRLGVLRSASLIRTNLTALLFAASFFGFQFVVVLYLQELRGWSALQTSFALLAIGIDAILAPLLTPRLVRRYGNSRVIVAGLLLAAVSYALFMPIGMDWTYSAMFPSMILLGLGFSLVYGPLTIAATDRIAEDEQGLAGGLLYTSFQFGAALGLSAVTTVLVATSGSDGSPQSMLDGYRAALVVPFVGAVLAASIAAFGLRRGRRSEAASEITPLTERAELAATVD